MSALRQTLRAALALSMPRRWLLVSNPVSSRAVCLTFDDGPHPEYTPRLLDVLREQGVTATFFVIGEMAENHPEIVRRMVAEGHAVGQHSYFHTEPAKTPTRQLMEEVDRTTKLLQDILGRNCPLFRPPKGHLTAGKMIALRRAGLHVILWNVDPRDYKSDSSAALGAWFGKHPLKGGDVVLLHDVKPFAAGVMGQIAAAVKESGLGFSQPLSAVKRSFAAQAAVL